jgi:penicillin-binding protein 1C
VTVRRALQMSLNLPALAVLDQVGASRLTARLTQAGATLVLPEGEAPGLAIGLGGVGIKLHDLVMLYAGLARLGTVLPLTEKASEGLPAAFHKAEANRLMEPVAAWYVGNILIGMPPPENGVAGRVAFKTGTSYGYRDAWSVGFDGRTTIGVWVGRPDGAAVPGLVGRMAAAPILFDAFARLPAQPASLPRAPSGILLTTSAKLPPPLRFFKSSEQGGAETKLHILFPPDGARLDLAAAADDKPALVPLKIAGGTAPLTILVNGVPAAAQTRGRLFFQPPGPGFARITVIDGAGAADSVMVRLDDGSAAATTAGAIRPGCAPGACVRP